MRKAPIAAAPISVEGGEAYGFCLHLDTAGALHGFPNTKSGVVSHIPLTFSEYGKVIGTTESTWQIDSQTEGCVVDDSTGELFVGEENRGIWRFDVRSPTLSSPALVVDTSADRELVPDVEGLALWSHGGRDYLVASSQGSDRFVVIDRRDYSVAGAFHIRANREKGIDGVSDTDGIEITSAALDHGDFTIGIMVAHDGHNDGSTNFKIISMKAVSEALGLAE